VYFTIISISDYVQCTEFTVKVWENYSLYGSSNAERVYADEPCIMQMRGDEVRACKIC
jgi:hypothetical protein